MSSAVEVGRVSRFMGGSSMGREFSLPPERSVGVVGPYSSHYVTFTPQKNQTFYISSASAFEAVEPEEAKAFAPLATDYSPRTHGGHSGSDPEIFVVDKEGAIIPAWEFLPSKETSGQRNAYPSPFWDGFQAEFTTRPGGCHAYLVDDIQRGLERVWKLAREKVPDAQLTAKSVLDIPQDVLRGASPEHVALGCSPSLNAYGDEGPMLGTDPAVVPYRFAGCHIHLGQADAKDREKFPRWVKTMDAIAGVAAVSLFEGMEDPRRRHFYGLAGEYRTPPHGLEYRTLPSEVLCHPVVTHLCFDLARTAAGMARAGLGWLWEASEDKVRHVINECDVEGARQILKDNSEVFAKLMDKNYPGNLAARRLFLEGALDLLETKDLVSNWRLGAGSWLEHSGSPNCCVSRLGGLKK